MRSGESLLAPILTPTIPGLPFRRASRCGQPQAVAVEAEAVDDQPRPPAVGRREASDCPAGASARTPPHSTKPKKGRGAGPAPRIACRSPRPSRIGFGTIRPRPARQPLVVPRGRQWRQEREAADGELSGPFLSAWGRGLARWKKRARITGQSGKACCPSRGRGSGFTGRTAVSGRDGMRKAGRERRRARASKRGRRRDRNSSSTNEKQVLLSGEMPRPAFSRACSAVDSVCSRPASRSEHR